MLKAPEVGTAAVEIVKDACPVSNADTAVTTCTHARINQQICQLQLKDTPAL